jgi:15-cis-phytoene synthase
MASRDTNFYYSFVVLPADKRRAILAVWDFCRAVDDAVDEVSGGTGTPEGRAAAAAEIAKWRRELAACYAGRGAATSQANALAPWVAQFNVPRQAFEDVIDGVEMDLGRCRWATFDDLYQYCLRVASAVGLACIEIFGYRNPGCRQYAIELGVALQLTNILRDLGKDLRDGRLYIPQEDLARFDVSENDLRMGTMTSRVRALVTWQARRAREYYARADRALPREDARNMVAARIMGAIYLDLLRQIERSDYAVFGEGFRLSRPRKALIAARTWMQTMLGVGRQ